MKATRILAGVLSLLLLAVVAAAEDKNLLSLASDLGAVLEWDPLRGTGVLSFAEDRIALGVGTSVALINYRLKVEIDPPVRRDGAVWLTTAAVTAISEAVQRDRLAHAAEQMRVAYILIDPGHGGEDPGGSGSFMDGKKKVTVREKDIVLNVARKLSDLLKAAFPDKKILFTRSDDTYVSLEGRTDIANAFLDKTKETVLYVSIHANSTPSKTSKASGYEAWILPPSTQRKLLDEKTVARENLDILPILNSMVEEEILLESTFLAQEILHGLDALLGKLTDDRGLRQNDWYVVRNARMPAVLVEVGFVNNPEEAARLADDSYLKSLAEGLYSGIGAFIARFEQNGSAGAR